MATIFYKLKENNKLYRIDVSYDDENNLKDYVCRNLVMARDASIENYQVRFICYDTTFNKNIMFKYDVGLNNSNYTEYIDEDHKYIKTYLTTSKKNADNFCKELDLKLNKDEQEGQDC